MKIAVLNFSGNVGKSTVAKHVLHASIPNAPLITVETINADEGGDEQMKGKEFGKLQEDLMLVDAAVVDIGASNVEAVMLLMRQFRGSHQEFDRFVVPTTREAKQTRDTIATIEALAEMGVPPDRIRVVFNRLELGEDVDDVFGGLIRYHQDGGKFTLDRNAVLVDSELFQRLRALNVSIKDLAEHPVEHWKAKMREATDASEKEQCIAMISATRLAASAKENIERCFQSVAA
jgi:MinD-like ATPase involved in chromosome partitioning or flagellar assembly